MAEIYLHHSILMFNNLPKQSEATQFKTGDSKRKFFDALPSEFTRQQAVETGKQFQLSPRTVDDILHNAAGGLWKSWQSYQSRMQTIACKSVIYLFNVNNMGILPPI